jgi:thiosulfate/3-mercaptopyruvate sulfurtransferase
MEDKVLLDPKDLSDRLGGGDVIAIDTRDPESFAAGHIPGAVNAHDIFTYLATSTPEGQKELQEKFAEIFGAAGLSGKELAVVYEQSMNTGFGQSCRGYYLLKFLGYPRAAVLHGGFQAWTDEKLPTTTEASTPVSKPFPVDPEAAGLIVDAKTMLDAVNNPAIVKLDVRDVDEWVGTSSSPYGVDFCPRKGRIPGARWLEWYRMMKPGKNGAGHSVLFQGCTDLQHLRRFERSWGKGYPHLFRVMERMVAGPVFADRGGISRFARV